jgi:hypothetical protein
MKKHLLAVIGAVTLMLAVSAVAQVSAVDFISGGTIYSNVTKTTGFTAVKIDKHKEVGLQLKFQGDRATTGVMTYILARSMDGSTYETSPRLTFAVAANGNTAVVLYTNLTSTWVGSAKYLKIVSIANADTFAGLNFTNVQCSAVLKKGN